MVPSVHVTLLLTSFFPHPEKVKFSPFFLFYLEVVSSNPQASKLKNSATLFVFQVKLGFDVLQEQERVLSTKDSELEGVRQELKIRVRLPSSCCCCCLELIFNGASNWKAF